MVRCRRVSSGRMLGWIKDRSRRRACWPIDPLHGGEGFEPVGDGSLGVPWRCGDLSDVLLRLGARGRHVVRPTNLLADRACSTVPWGHLVERAVGQRRPRSPCPVCAGQGRERYERVAQAFSPVAACANAACRGDDHWLSGAFDQQSKDGLAVSNDVGGPVWCQLSGLDVSSGGLCSCRARKPRIVASRPYRVASIELRFE